MKFRIIVTVLTIAIIGLFASTVILSLKLKDNIDAKNILLEKYKDAGLTIEFLENENSKKSIEYAKLLNEGTQSKWEITSSINTLNAYSTFVENCNREDEDCHQTELENAINTLLNAEGYVEFVETNGNKLYTEVSLALEGEFVKFSQSKNVRNGAIGINNCGESNPTKIGIVLKDRIVKVLAKCEANGSDSVWAKIQYTN